MLPIGLLPFPIDSGLLSNILRNLLIVSPFTLLLTGMFILGFLSLKTLSAKLVFLGLSMFVSSVIMFIAYKQEKKEVLKQQQKKSFIDYIDKASPVNSQINTEEKDLMLSKIFNK